MSDDQASLNTAARTSFDPGVQRLIPHPAQHGLTFT